MTGTIAALAGDNSLPDLAARIRAEHEAVSTALKESVRHAITAGELLVEAKGQLATVDGCRGYGIIARSPSGRPSSTCAWRKIGPRSRTKAKKPFSAAMCAYPLQDRGTEVLAIFNFPLVACEKMCLMERLTLYTWNGVQRI
jgi:hypothetical protein